MSNTQEIIDNIDDPQEFLKTLQETHPELNKETSKKEEENTEEKSGTPSLEEINKTAQEGVKQAIKESGIGQKQTHIEVLPKEVPSFATTKEFVRHMRTNKNSFADTKKFIKDVWTSNRKALSDAVDADGGFTIPDEWESQIFRIMESFGLVRARARFINTTAGKLRLNRQGATNVSVAFVDSCAQIGESQPNFEQLVLDPKQIAGITTWCNPLMEDTISDLIGFLTDIYAEAFAGFEDNQALNGDGTGSNWTGLYVDSGVGEVVMGATNVDFSDVTYDNLVDLIYTPKSSVLNNAIFTMHREVFAIVQKLKDSNGLPIFVPAASAGVAGGSAIPGAGNLLGYPVFLNDKNPAAAATAVSTSFILFGNWSNFIVAQRTGVTTAFSTEGTVGSNKLFEQNMTGIRLIERIDAGAILPAAFAKLTTAAS